MRQKKYRTLGHRFGLLLILLFLIPSVLRAQIANGVISGRVTDNAGATVPGADVTVTKVETNLQLHGKTNDEGYYNFPSLLTGTYRVEVSHTGFKKAQANITLGVGQSAQVDLAIEPGAVTETVNVNADSLALLNTDNPTLSYTVGARQVNELPLNGRNPYALAALSPGIAPGAYFGSGVSTTRGALVAAATNNFQSNGGIAGSNEILLDGVAITLCCQGQPAVTVSAEVVEQFKVITSNPGAQYGRSSGGFLNIVTKSGTNSLHGDVYEYLRNDKLDAASYFQKRSKIYPYAGKKDYRAPHRFNQFGAFVGGPVFIPRLYDGRNKTFFTFGYEGQRNLLASTITTTVPTQLMRQGIFSENTGKLVYDPYSTTKVGNTYTRTPLPAGCNANGCFAAGGGVINLDPVATKLLALYPLPNQPGLTSNYIYAKAQTDRDDQYNFRIDHNFSEKQRVFVRGTRSVNQHRENDLFNQPTGPNSVYQPISAYLFAIGDTWTISPALLLQTTFGFANQRNNQIPGNYGIDAGSYGFSSNFLSEQQTAGLPVVSISGFSNIGNSASSNRWNHYAYYLTPILSWQHGGHTTTFGYDGRLIFENQPSYVNPLGTLAYDSTLTRGSDASQGYSGTDAQFAAMAAFLLGVPTTTNLTRQQNTAMHQWYQSIFAQDDWRITPKFTLNLGIRYEHEGAMRDRYNRWASIDLNAANPLSTAAFPVKGGAQYVGVNGNPSGFWKDYNHFSPRVGFAYSPQTGTVVRGGYDMLFLPTSQRMYSSGTLGFQQNTQKAYSYTDVPTTTTANPLPNGVVLPAGPSAGVSAGTGTSVTGLLYNNPQPYYQQWNFGVEQQLANGIILHLNYAGSKGTHLPINVRPNDLQPKYWGAVGDPGGVQTAYLTASVPNPFYNQPGVAPALNVPTVQRQQLLAAYPQYYVNNSMQNWSMYIIQDDIGSASYNGMQAFLTIQRSTNLTATLSYTWSKLLGNVVDVTTGQFNSNGQPDLQNFYRLDMENSYLPADVPHRFVANANYTLPFGRGQRFGANVPGWVNQIIGGWKLNTIVAVQSGFALGITQSGGPAYSGSRPSFNPGVNPLTTGSVKNRLGGGATVGQTQGYFNPAAFRLPYAFELGNVPRVSGQLRSPIGFQDDLSAIKEFPIHESIRLQFRLEAFNFLNKVQFGVPNTTFGSGTFGQITGLGNSPRNVQAALKLYF